MNKNTFKDVSRVITAINSILGVRNFKNPVNKRKYLCTWIYNISVLCIFSITVLVLEFIYAQQARFRLQRVIYVLWTVVHVLNFVFLVIANWYYSKDTLALREKIAKLDKSFKSLGSVENNCNLLYRLIITAIVWICSATVQFGLHINEWLQEQMRISSLYRVITSIYRTSTGQIILYDYLLHVNWLELKFKQTNDLLKTTLVDDHRIKTEVSKYSIKPTRNRHQQFLKSFNKYARDNKYHFRRLRIFPSTHASNLKQESQAAKKVNLLQQIRVLHLQLCRIAKMVNKVFNTQLMILSYTALLNVSTILYSTYVEIRLGSAGLLINFVMGFLKSLHFVITLAMTSHDCERAAREANKIREIIHEFSMHDLDSEMKDEIFQFSLQISLCQFEISKRNPFLLNYVFLQKCISFVVTYLVVMIQFGQYYYYTYIKPKKTHRMFQNETAST